MGVLKQSVSSTEAAYARELVERDDCSTLSAAVSGELARAWASRERDRALLEAEVQRRLEAPLDRWITVGALDDLTRGASARIDALQRKAGRESREQTRADRAAPAA